MRATAHIRHGAHMITLCKDRGPMATGEEIVVFEVPRGASPASLKKAVFVYIWCPLCLEKQSIHELAHTEL